MNFSQLIKQIHIGQLIQMRCSELEVDDTRLDTVLKDFEITKETLFQSEAVNTNLLLKLSKLLDYDFFRIYTQHIILYAPPSAPQNLKKSTTKSKLPEFRKNIYTVEIIQFVIEKITSKEKTVREIMDEYKIPKTTLYKWLTKYK